GPRAGGVLRVRRRRAPGVAAHRHRRRGRGGHRGGGDPQRARGLDALLVLTRPGAVIRERRPRTSSGNDEGRPGGAAFVGEPEARLGSVQRAQRETLPAFRQPVHTLTRLGVPSIVARTRWMLGL